MQKKKKLLIIGGGFAGFWSAISAVRQMRNLEKEEELQITVVNPDPYLTVRPRLYETSLEGIQVDLIEYFEPLSIQFILGKVESISQSDKRANIFTENGIRNEDYDYLILAAGSLLKCLNISGIEKSFNVDTFENAVKLENHLKSLAENAFSQNGAPTFVVAGSGLTGLEMVTTIKEKAELIQSQYSYNVKPFRIVLIERNNEVADYYSPEARAYIFETLKKKNIEILSGTYIESIDDDQVKLNNGSVIHSKTVIFCTGMMASPLTAFFDGERDVQGRLLVENTLQLPGDKTVFVAGDVANVTVSSAGESSVMACQFSMDLGKWAGHNAVNDMFSMDLKPYVNNNYGTCLDLGQEDGLITNGFDRKLLMKGSDAKQIKTEITTQHIYPPKDLEETLFLSFPKVLTAEIFYNQQIENRTKRKVWRAIL